MSVAGLLLIACDLAAAPSDPTGGFVSFPSDWYKRIYDAPDDKKTACFNELWRREFLNLKAMKFDTIVVQFTLRDRALYFDARVNLSGSVVSPNKGDALYRSLAATLEQAEARQMKVWVGLRHKEIWNSTNWASVVADQEAVVNDSLVVARALVDAKILKPETFAGWYISPEIDNFDKDPDKTAVDGNAMLKTLGAGLDEIARKAGLIPAGKPHVPIALSAYYRDRPANMDEGRYLDFLKKTLTGAGITHLLFQDGVGVEDSPDNPRAGLDKESKDALVNRYASILKLGRAIGFETWAVIEAFTGDRAEQGASIGRVRDQLAAASACDKRIVYSSNNHLSAFATRPRTAELFRSLYLQLAGMAYDPQPVAACEAK